MSQATRIITSDAHPAFQKLCYEEHLERSGNREERAPKRDANFGRRAMFNLLGRGRGGEVSRNQPIDGGRIRRILVFRYDAVGDYVVTTMLLRWLREALPDATIDMLSSFRNRSLIEIDPAINWSYPLDDQNTLVTPAFARLPGQRPPYDYDLLFALPTSRMTRAAIIARLVAPAAEKITVIHRDRQELYGKVFTRQMERRQWREHWAETFLRMATEYIIPARQPQRELIRPYLVIDQKPWEKTLSFLRENELAFPGFAPHIVRTAGWEGEAPRPFQGTPYCVVNISAHNIERQWGPERCAAACRLLLDLDPELRIFISGSPADSGDVERTCQLVGNPRCRKVALKLAEFIAFVAGAKFVITPDTATLHIAAAAGRPTIGLFAEDIKACEWYPYGTEFVLLVSPTEESVNLIEPESIARAAMMLSVQAPAAATISNSILRR